MGRHIVINGTRGRLEYHDDENGPVRCLNAPSAPGVPSGATPVAFAPKLFVQPLFGSAYELPVPTNQGDHDGADPLMCEMLFGVAESDKGLIQRAGYEQGAVAALVGIAANESIARGGVTDMAELAPWLPQTKQLSQLR